MIEVVKIALGSVSLLTASIRIVDDSSVYFYCAEEFVFIQIDNLNRSIVPILTYVGSHVIDFMNWFINLVFI